MTMLTYLLIWCAISLILGPLIGAVIREGEQ